jgi:hypothetical protein
MQELEAPIISTQSAHKSGEVVSPTYRPPLTQEISRLLIYVGGG